MIYIREVSGRSRLGSSAGHPQPQHEAPEPEAVNIAGCLWIFHRCGRCCRDLQGSGCSAPEAIDPASSKLQAPSPKPRRWKEPNEKTCTEELRVMTRPLGCRGLFGPPITPFRFLSPQSQVPDCEALKKLTKVIVSLP